MKLKSPTENKIHSLLRYMHTVVIYLSISTNIFLAWLAQGKLSLNLSLLAGGEHSPFP